MARTRQVRYWASRKGGGYFTTIRGKQVELSLGPDDQNADGPVYRAAMAKYLSLVSLDASPRDASVRAVCNAYRIHLQATKNPKRRHFDAYVKSFADMFADRLVNCLDPKDVTEWLAGQKTWSEGSGRTAVNLLLSALNWAVKEGHASTHSLAGRVVRGEESRRGREYRLEKPLCDLLIATAHTAPLRLFLRAIYATGARPIELSQAKVKNLQGNVIVLPWSPPRNDYRHKTAKKTKKDRIICLPPDVADDVREGAKGRDVDSPLLLSSSGGHWKPSTLQRNVAKILATKRVRDYLALTGRDSRTVVLYSFRHTFISDWIDKGLSVKICAALCGTSVALIERVYGHHEESALYDFYSSFLAVR